MNSQNLSSNIFLTQGSWPYIIFIYICGIMVTASSGIFGPVVLDMAEKFQANPTEIGAAAGLFFLPAVFLGGPLGWVMDKIGTSVVFRTAGFALAVTMLMVYYAQSFLQIQVIMVLAGCCFVSVMISCEARLMETLSGKRQAQALSMWATSISVGIALGVLLIGKYAGGENWSEGFLVYALIIVVVYVFSFILPKSVMVEDHEVDSKETEMTDEVLALQLGSDKVIKNKNVLRLGISLMIGGMVNVGSMLIAPTFLSSSLGITIENATQIVFVGGFGAIFGGLLIGTLFSKDWQPKHIYMILLVLITVGGALFFGNHNVPILSAVGFFIWQGANAALFATTYALLPKAISHPSQSGRSAGIIAQIINIGYMFSPAIWFALNNIGNIYFFIGISIMAFIVVLFVAPVWGTLRPTKAFLEKN